MPTRAPAHADDKSIPAVAAAEPNLQTFTAAVKVAGAVPGTATNFHDNLRDHGPFTVFAPSDEAFEQIPEEAFHALLEHHRHGAGHLLVELLSRHVVAGKLTTADLGKLDGRTVMTLQGTELPVKEEDKVTVGGANLLATLKCSNGLIHVIDRVLPVPHPVGPLDKR